MAVSKDLEIKKGKTFTLTLRWETEPIVYRPITGMQQTAPVRITAPAHGLVTGWNAAVTNAKGMTELNAEPNKVKDKDYHRATVVDSDTIEFNDVNAVGFKAYVSGGVLQYNTPAPLAGTSARATIKDKVGGTVLLTLTGANGKIAIDQAAKTITLTLSATETAALVFSKGVYDLEIQDAGGTVTLLMEGKVQVTNEVTT